MFVGSGEESRSMTAYSIAGSLGSPEEEFSHCPTPVATEKFNLLFGI